MRLIDHACGRDGPGAASGLPTAADAGPLLPASTSVRSGCGGLDPRDQLVSVLAITRPQHRHHTGRRRKLPNDVATSGQRAHSPLRLTAIVGHRHRSPAVSSARRTLRGHPTCAGGRRGNGLTPVKNSRRATSAASPARAARSLHHRRVRGGTAALEAMITRSFVEAASPRGWQARSGGATLRQHNHVTRAPDADPLDPSASRSRRSPACRRPIGHAAVADLNALITAPCRAHAGSDSLVTLRDPVTSPATAVLASRRISCSPVGWSVDHPPEQPTERIGYAESRHAIRHSPSQRLEPPRCRAIWKPSSAAGRPGRVAVRSSASVS